MPLSKRREDASHSQSCAKAIAFHQNFARSALECGESSHRFSFNQSGAAIQSSRNRAMDLFENFAHPVAKLPVWIMRLELSYIADPPDVVADAIGFLVAPV